MSRSKHAPQHRAAKHRAERRPLVAVPSRTAAVRGTLLLSSMAVTATGAAVAGGVLNAPVVSEAAQAVAPALGGSEAVTVADREDAVSRSDFRESADPAKEATLSASEGEAITREEDLAGADPRTIAQALLPEYGFSSSEFGCLDSLYVSESDWRIDADNPYSSAYGIPQALTELHDLPADYMTNPVTQIRWGLDYIRDNYGTPCNAWSFKQGNGWY